MAVNPRLAGYLSRALDHEIGAVQQYLTQATLCSLWGLRDEASQLRREVEEELGHAQKLIQHMLVLGLAPTATQLAPVRPGRNLREMLELDRVLEADAILLYEEAVRYCERFREETARRLFYELMQDEEHHLSEIDVMLAALQEKELSYG